MEDTAKEIVYFRYCGEVQRIIGTQREANHCEAALGLSSTFVEKHCCIRDLGPGLEVVGVESFAKGSRISDVVCDLAVIEVWGKCHELPWGHTRLTDCGVQPIDKASVLFA